MEQGPEERDGVLEVEQQDREREQEREEHVAALHAIHMSGPQLFAFGQHTGLSKGWVPKWSGMCQDVPGWDVDVDVLHVLLRCM